MEKSHRKFLIKFILFALVAPVSWGAVEAPTKSEHQPLKTKSHALRQKISKLEGDLLSSEKKLESIKTEIKKLERLLRLQELEIELGQVEVQEIELQLQELQIRRLSIEDSITAREEQLTESLIVLYSLKKQNIFSLVIKRNFAMQSYLRQTLVTLTSKVQTELEQIEEMQIEQSSILSSMQKKKEDLLANIEELKEKKVILELNRKNKAVALNKNKSLVSKKIESIRQAKIRESRLRKMLEQSQVAKTKDENDEDIAKIAAFKKMKGSLPWPTRGRITNSFGKKYDKATSLYSFHKGIDIKTGGAELVKAIFPGKVVFSGKLGGYGELVIVDHGDRFFTLVGQLSKRLKKEGDEVQAGEHLGQSFGASTPVYFEIRHRHIALNPVPWLEKPESAVANN